MGLSDEQQAGIEHVLRMPKGEACLWIGRAGSGKSFAVRELQKRLPNTLVGAYSGITARALSGVTIDRMMNYPVSANKFHGFVFNPDWKYNEYIYQLRLIDQREGTRYAAIFSANRKPKKHELKSKKYLKPYAEALRVASCVIVEEAYAITCDKIDFLDMKLRYVMNEPHVKWGGKKVLLLGDAAQFGPIVHGSQKRAYEKAGYKEPFNLETCKVFK